VGNKKHSDEVLRKISDAKVGSIHSEKTKKIMSDSKKGEKNPMYGQPKPSGAGTPYQSIEVFDLQEKTITSYNSFSEAARALNLPSHKAISDYIKNNQKKPYKGRYTFALKK
jgi:group I intron endonuclease